MALNFSLGKKKGILVTVSYLNDYRQKQVHKV